MLTLSEFHNFSPTFENELRVAYSRHNQLVPVGRFCLPGIECLPKSHLSMNCKLQIGPDPNAPSGGIQNLSTGQENITKSFGRHTIKAGYNFTDIILSSFFVQRVRGDYDYATLAGVFARPTAQRWQSQRRLGRANLRSRDPAFPRVSCSIPLT